MLRVETRRRRRRPHRPRPARGEERARRSRCATASSTRSASFRADPTCARCSSPATGDAFCAGMDLAASTVAQAGKPGFTTRATVGGAARRRADVHPRAVGARQADGRGGERRRGRPGRAPRARVRLRARARRGTRFMWSFAKWGLVVDAGGAYLLPRLVGLPRAKAMVMLGEGVDRRRGGRPRARLPVRRRRRRAAAGRATRSRRRLAAGPTRSLGLSKRLLNATFETDLAALARARGPLPGARDHVARPRRGHGRVPEKRDADFTGHVTPAAVQRVAAYNVCVDDARSAAAVPADRRSPSRPGWWTLPGGGIEFGEHPGSGGVARAARGDRA